MKKAKSELLRKIHGAQICQLIGTAARLKIADAIPDKGIDLPKLAETMHIERTLLKRFIHALEGLDLLAFKEGWITLKEQGLLLRSDHTDSVQAIAAYKGSKIHFRAQEYLYEGLLSGSSPFDLAFGMELFDYLNENKEMGVIFQAAMQCYEMSSSQAILDGYDFSTFSTLVDVGGGRGSLLKTLIEKDSNLSGILYDLPEVIASITDPHPHINYQSGSFFDSVPEGDAYILRNILHDWNDEKCIEILNVLRKKNKPVFVIETLLEEGRRLGRFADMTMFVMTRGGRERSLDEYEPLFTKSNFRIKNIIRSTASKALIELNPKD